MLSIEKTTGDELYASPFLTGGAGNNEHVKIDVSALTSREVDARGYLKIGTPINPATGLLPTAAGQRVVAVAQTIRVAKNNTDLSSITNDPLIGCRTEGGINHDMLVDILGAVLTANEIAAINGAGSRLFLTQKSA